MTRARTAAARLREVVSYLQMECGARMADDVVGFPVGACSREPGHDGECEGRTGNGETVRWMDSVDLVRS